MDKTISLKKDSLSFFLSKGFTYIFSLLVGICIARSLGPTGKGAINIIKLIPSMIFPFISLGIFQANVYFIGQKKDNISDLFVNSTTYALIIGNFLAFVMWLLRGQIAFWFSLKPYQTEIGIASLMVPLIMLENYYLFFLVGQKKVLERNIVPVIDNGISFLLLLLLFFCKGLNTLNIIMAFTVSSLIAVIYAYIAVTRDTPSKFLGFEWPLFKKTANYGIKVQVGYIMQILNLRLDTFVINYFIGIYNVGIYGTAVTIAEILWNIPDVIGTLLFQKVSDSQSRFDDMNIVSTCRKTLLLTSAATIFLIPIAGYFIPLLYGSRFSASFIPFILLLPGIIAMSVYKILIQALMAKGYPQYMTIIGFFSVIFTLLLDMVLIPAMGVKGASLASTVTYGVCMGVSLYWYKKVSLIPIRDIIVPQKNDIQYFINLIGGVINKISSHKSNEK